MTDRQGYELMLYVEAYPDEIDALIDAAIEGIEAHGVPVDVASASPWEPES